MMAVAPATPGTYWTPRVTSASATCSEGNSASVPAKAEPPFLYSVMPAGDPVGVYCTWIPAAFACDFHWFMARLTYDEPEPRALVGAAEAGCPTTTTSRVINPVSSRASTDRALVRTVH